MHPIATDNRAHAKQAFDLCKVVDKQRQGVVAVTNFTRIAQVCGLKVDDETLAKYTNQTK